MIQKLLRRAVPGLCSPIRNYSTGNSAMNFIFGKRASPVDVCNQIKNINPATGESLNDILCSGKKEVNRAVDAAADAFSHWSKICSRNRGQVLIAAANTIRSRLEEIARYEVLDTGKPIWEARVDIAGCADVLEYYGGIAAAAIKGDHHDLQDGNFAIVRREPLGVVAGIGAWNYPFQVMSWKAAPALICGNTFVYKPSQFTPISSVVLAEILTDSGVPPGAVNVIQGDGATGELICAHPKVSKVTFTGSLSTGRKIMSTCSETMKKVTMELGGKSALLVFPDCNIVNAVKATLLGNFLTQGEVCSNCTRVYVHDSILESFVSQLVLATENMVVGDPLDDSTTVGAMINHEHGQKVLGFIQDAKKEGAQIACGGKRIVLDGKNSGGFYISPCVLTNCTEDMKCVKEEIFGPVVSILSFHAEEEAVKRANSLSYGLAAGVMTKDIQRAHRVASQLQAGIVWINNYNVFPPEVPFGGCKLSGFGRENGLAAIQDFSQMKTIYVEMNQEIICPIYKE